MSTEFRKLAFHTLGCKLNFAESSMLKTELIEKGFQSVQFNDGADVFVINTCSVTENADRECRKIIRRAAGRDGARKPVRHAPGCEPREKVRRRHVHDGPGDGRG